jgi:methyl-accepting chemotaxis protein
MFRLKSITGRFVVSVSALLAVLVLGSLGFTLGVFNESLDSAEEREMAEIYENIVTTIDTKARMGQSMAALVAGIPQVQEAFAKGDREALTALFGAGFPELKKQYGIRQFQFHSPPATSFLRVHKLKKFGDDLSSFRHTVVATNAEKKPIHGAEVGVAGLGLRGIVPVFQGEKHLGSVEFGVSFGQHFFEEFSKQHELDLILSLDRKEGLETFASTLGEMMPMTPEQLAGALRGKPLLQHALVDGKEVAVYARKVDDYSGKPLGVLQIVKERSYYAGQMSYLRNVMLAAGFAALLLVGGLVLLLARSLTKPLMRTVIQMEAIAGGEGDLDSRMPEAGHDETARLAAAFNRFIEKIVDIIRQVDQSVNSLNRDAGELSRASENTHQGMQRQQGETSQIATAMTEMSATVHNVADSSAQAAQAAREVDQQANSGMNVVAETVASIKQLASEVDNAGGVVRRVDEDTTRISTVLDVIKGIAEQTNLLALNAAIEAARAGDQGRGFAVVADEVRSLAQRTQQSTQEIQEMIESLQAGVAETVNVMKHSHTSAQHSVDQAALASETLAAITASVDTISQMNAQIATASEQQSAVAEEINRNVISIAEVTGETATDAEQSSRSSSHIMNEIQRLTGLVAQFRFSRETSAG